MENRSQILRELFKLIIYLNKGNPKANTKTNLAFDIQKNNFGCYLIGIKDSKFLILCFKINNYKWQASGYTQFIYLEDYCSERLNFHHDEKQALKNIIDDLRSLQFFNR